MSTPSTYFSTNHCHDYACIKTPPKYTCFVVLLDRKLIAARKPPLTLKAARVARSIDFSNDNKPTFRICVHSDRLVLHARHRNDNPSPIFFDDIMQLEKLKDDILFVLCGLRGLGAYYFFRFSDRSVMDGIMNVVRQTNDDLVSVETKSLSLMQDFPSNSMYNGRTEEGATYELNNYRSKHNNITSSSPCRGSNSDDSLCRKAFINWEGNGNGSSHPYRSQSHSNREFSNRSRCHSQQESNIKTVYMKAERTKGRATSRSKHGAMRPWANNPPILEPFRRPTLAKPHNYTNQRLQNIKAADKPKPKSSKRPTPRTFIFSTNSKANGRNIPRQGFYDPLEFKDDPTNWMRSDRRIKPSRYNNTTLQGRYIDRYNHNQYRSFEQGQVMGFNAPNAGGSQLRNKNISYDSMSSSTDDSLYLEPQWQYERPSLENPTNYLPELRNKFRELDLS